MRKDNSRKGIIMNIKIISLCDVDDIEIPNEMLDVSVGDDEIEEEIAHLSVRYAEKVGADTAEKGDVVRCFECGNENGRRFILFTGTVLPGAESASQDVLKKKVGDVFKTELFGKEITLQVEKITRALLASVNDALISKIGEEGVSTVGEYRDFLKKKKSESKIKERKKEIGAYIFDELEKSSIFEYDAVEAAEYIDEKIKEYDEIYGEEFSDENIEEVKTFIMSDVKRKVVAEEFCKSRGIEIDISEAENDVQRYIEIAELTGEAVPEKEVLLEDALKNRYYEEIFKYIDCIISKRMENRNGNC